MKNTFNSNAYCAYNNSLTLIKYIDNTCNLHNSHFVVFTDMTYISKAKQ